MASVAPGVGVLRSYDRDWLSKDLDEALNADGISLIFAELKDPVRRKIERYGLTRTIDPQHFFPTLEAAVEAYRADTGMHWEPRPAQQRDVHDERSP